MTTEKRSSSSEQQPDLFGLAPSPSPRAAHLRPLRLSQGLSGHPPGARPGRPAPPGAGGGSRHSCTGSESPVGRAPPPAPLDPRIAELREFGLAHVWLSVAEAIGFETWLRVWEVLAVDESVVEDRRRAYVPPLDSFLRYQRNALIRQMATEGRSVHEIREALRRLLSENLSMRNLHRLVRELCH